MPQAIGRVVSLRMATLNELQTVYGSEDFYDLLEIMAVDSFNENVMSSEQRG